MSTTNLVNDLRSIYNTKVAIKSALGTDSDVFSDYPGYITDYNTRLSYVEENKLEASDLEGYATEAYVTSAIEAIPGVDLTGYATESYVMSQGFLTEHQSLSDYVTATELSNAGYLTAHQDISGKADKTELAAYVTKDELSNAGYITSHQSLSGYATESYVTSKIEAVVGAAPAALDTLQEIGTALNNDADFAGTMTTALASKANAADVYSKTEIDNAAYVTATELSNAGYLTSHQDLSNYALKSELPSLSGYATEDFVTTRGYLTEHQDISSKADKSELAAYVTKTELSSCGYLTAHQSLDDYATKAYVMSNLPSLEGYATEAYVMGKGFLTEHQNLSDYATKAEIAAAGYLTSHQSLSGYATEAYVTSAISGIDIPSLEDTLTFNTDRVSEFEIGEKMLDEHGKVYIMNPELPEQDPQTGDNVWDDSNARFALMTESSTDACQALVVENRFGEQTISFRNYTLEYDEQNGENLLSETDAKYVGFDTDYSFNVWNEDEDAEVFTMPIDWLVASGIMEEDEDHQDANGDNCWKFNQVATKADVDSLISGIEDVISYILGTNGSFSETPSIEVKLNNEAITVNDLPVGICLGEQTITIKVNDWNDDMYIGRLVEKNALNGSEDYGPIYYDIYCGTKMSYDENDDRYVPDENGDLYSFYLLRYDDEPNGIAEIQYAEDNSLESEYGIVEGMPYCLDTDGYGLEIICGKLYSDPEAFKITTGNYYAHYDNNGYEIANVEWIDDMTLTIKGHDWLVVEPGEFNPEIGIIEIAAWNTEEE